MKKKYYANQFLRNYQKIRLQKVYLINGEENLLINKVLAVIINKYFSEKEKQFDYHTFYGDDDKKIAEKVVEGRETAPFLAQKKAVVLKRFEAVNLLQQKLIADYALNPFHSSILILVAEKVDGRKKIFKNILKNGLQVICNKPYNPENLEGWLRAELRQRNLMMDRKAIDLFVNSVELDYMTAKNELDKLVIFTKNSKQITYEDVKACVGNLQIHGIFDLQDALGEKNKSKALKIAENLILNNVSVIYVATMLQKYFTTLWRINLYRNQNINDMEIKRLYLKNLYYKFRDKYLHAAGNFNIDSIEKIFCYLLDVDTKLKTSSLEPGIILAVLVCKILGA